MIWEYLKLSINELVNNKLRSFLSLIGIVIGVAVVFIIFSISDITNTAITNAISGSKGVLTIQFVQDKSDESAIFRLSLGIATQGGTNTLQYRAKDVEELEKIEGIAGAMANYSTTQKVSIGKKTTFSTIFRNSDTFLEYYEFDLIEGRSILDYPPEERVNLVMVSHTFVDHYLEIERSEAIGKKMMIYDRLFTIVGVVQTPANSGAVSVLSQEAYDLLFSESTLKNISVKIAPGYPLRDTAQLAADRLNQIHGYTNTKEGYVLEDLSFLLDQIKVVTGILSLVMGIIASISLLVAGIGVMNIMLVSVVERTREIGVKRAIGASKTAIQFQFIVESCLLTFVGGVIGVIIGVVVIELVLIALDMQMAINIGYIIFALLFSISLGLLFGYLPSKRAANLNIIEAIQSE